MPVEPYKILAEKSWWLNRDRKAILGILDNPKRMSRTHVVYETHNGHIESFAHFASEKPARLYFNKMFTPASVSQTNTVGEVITHEDIDDILQDALETDLALLHKASQEL